MTNAYAMCRSVTLSFSDLDLCATLADKGSHGQSNPILAPDSDLANCLLLDMHYDVTTPAFI